MSVETVEKRERRLKRERLNLARVKHPQRFMAPEDALHHIVGFKATWDFVRRVAYELIRCEVREVFVCWQIIHYVKSLPDGKERLRVAIEDATDKWEVEVAA